MVDVVEHGHIYTLAGVVLRLQLCYMRLFAPDDQQHCQACRVLLCELGVCIYIRTWLDPYHRLTSGASPLAAPGWATRPSRGPSTPWWAHPCAWCMGGTPCPSSPLPLCKPHSALAPLHLVSMAVQHKMCIEPRCTAGMSGSGHFWRWSVTIAGSNGRFHHDH